MEQSLRCGTTAFWNSALRNACSSAAMQLCQPLPILFVRRSFGLALDDVQNLEEALSRTRLIPKGYHNSVALKKVIPQDKRILVQPFYHKFYIAAYLLKPLYHNNIKEGHRTVLASTYTVWPA